MSNTEDISAVDPDASKITNQDNSDFDAEEIQRKMSGLINDLKSESITPDDNNLRPRKSVTSGRLIDDQGNSSTPAIVELSSNNPSQGPIRSMSESVLIDHHDTKELPSTLPIQQDESSTEDDDDDTDFEGFSTNNKSVTPVNTTKQKDLDETVRFGATPRLESRSSKKSASTSGNEKQVSKSPLNGPRTPTPNDSSKNLINIESKEPPIAIISPASRRESTNKTDQQKTSRSSSRIKSKSKENSFELSNNEFLTTNEQSKLIKPGEQLKIPTNEINNERLNSPPPSPSTTKQMVLINPLLGGNNRVKTNQNNSRPTSQIKSSISNEKVINGDVVSSKSRRSSNTSQQQQRTILTDQKPNSSSNRKESNASEDKILNKKDSRRSSLQSKKNSNITTDQTIISPIKINSAKSGQQNQKQLLITDSENENLNNSKLPHINSSSQSTTPTEDKQTTNWTKEIHIPPLQTTDDEIPLSRPQSPNVEQITERNTINKKRKTDEQQRPLRRSNSAESFNHIPVVDDKSLDSTSGNNTESENPKPRRVKSKKKDVETNTDLRNGNHQQQQESTPQKPSKSMSDHPPSIRRRIPTKELNLTTPDTEPDSNTRPTRRSTKQSKNSNENKDPVDVNVNVLVKNLNNEDNDETSPKLKDKQKFRKTITDNERHTQSDTEQIITEKQKKRRRPKRISRTTQTYECVFRRMENEQHEELRPISDLDKNIQTKKSLLRPRKKSPKRRYPIYLSTDAFKIEEILPKQFPHTQRNISKTSVVARSNSPQTGKLLILRPTLPFHHTDAVNVQRISLQYAIDLIPNENKSNNSTPVQQNKYNSLKQSEQTNNLPMLRSSPTTNPSPNKSNTKDKSIPNRIEDRTYQRKDGGTV